MSDYLGKAPAIRRADESQKNLLATLESQPVVHEALERIRTNAAAAYENGEREFDCRIDGEERSAELSNRWVRSADGSGDIEIWVDPTIKSDFLWLDGSFHDRMVCLRNGVYVTVLPDSMDRERPKILTSLTRAAWQEKTTVRLAPQNALTDPRTGNPPKTLLFEVDIAASKERLFREFANLVHRIKDERNETSSRSETVHRHARRNLEIWRDMHHGMSATDAGLKHGPIVRGTVYKAINKLKLPRPGSKEAQAAALVIDKCRDECDGRGADQLCADCPVRLYGFA